MRLKDKKILIASSPLVNSINNALEAYRKLKNRAYNVFLDQNLSKIHQVEDKLPLGTEVDFIFVFGGDGAILRTYKYWKKGAILGINCGRVGFLAEIIPEQLDFAIKKIENEEFFYEEYSTVGLASPVYPCVPAVNDILITSSKIGQTITLEVEVNGEYLYTINGDGIIVSSTIGSSAYSRSAGGPLIMPNVNAFSLVPICQFLGRATPMVMNPETKIKITNLSKYRAASVAIDGEVYFNLGYKEHITITKSKEIVRFVRFSNNFIKRVREKILRLNADEIDG